jgi:hypothetical protein
MTDTDIERKLRQTLHTLARDADRAAVRAEMAIREELSGPHARPRRRHARQWMAVAASALAVAVIAVGSFALTRAPGTGSRNSSSSASQSPVRPPSRVNPLVPHASFGWLPPGYSASGVIGSGEDEQDASAETLIARPSANPGIVLMVFVAGACHVSGPSHAKPDHANPGFDQGARSLDCRSFYGQLNSTAPSVNGRAAYWSSCQPEQFCPPQSSKTAQQGRALVWQYRSDAWAVLHPRTLSAGLAGPLLLRVARDIRYGATAPQVFGFKLSDVPAGWQVDHRPGTGPEYVLYKGIPANTFVSIGPLTIFLHPAAWPGARCTDHTDPVTIDGAHGYFVTGNGQQSLCFDDLHGLYLSLTLNVGSNQSSGFSSVTAVFKHLRLLGPDPARWTTNPLGE